MTTNDVPADTGDAEALAKAVCPCAGDGDGQHIPELDEECAWSLSLARAVLASDWLAARDAAQRADERERIAQAIEAEGGGSVTFRIAANIARSGTAGGSNA